MTQLYKSTMYLAFTGCLALVPATSRAVVLDPVTVQGCSGTLITDSWGNDTCVSGYTGGDSGGGGGGSYYDGGGSGGGGGGTNLTTVIIPVPGYAGSKMNATATKITTPTLSLSDETEVRMGVVAAANAAHSTKALGSTCTVYYSTGETEKWIKIAGSGSFQWGPVAGSQTHP